MADPLPGTTLPSDENALQTASHRRGALPPLQALNQPTEGEFPFTNGAPPRRRVPRSASSTPTPAEENGADGQDIGAGVPTRRPKRRQPRQSPAPDQEQQATFGATDAFPDVAPHTDQQIGEAGPDAADGVPAGVPARRGRRRGGAAGRGGRGGRRKRELPAQAATGGGVENQAFGGISLAEFEDDVVPVDTATVLSNRRESLEADLGFGSAPSSGRPASNALTPRTGPVPMPPADLGAGGVTLGRTAPSQPTQRMYIEEKSRFRAQDKKQLAEQQEQMRKEAERLAAEHALSKWNSLSISLTTHTIVRKVCLFCQGLVAGFAFWHAIVVCMLRAGAVSSDYQFVQLYYRLALWVQTIYYVLLAPACLSLLDRVDVAHPSKVCLIRALTFQLPGLALVLYVLALVLSLVNIMNEDRIAVFSRTRGNGTATISTSVYNLFNDYTDVESRLNAFEGLSIARTSCVFFGWLLVCLLAPRTDRLKQHLRQAGNSAGTGLEPEGSVQNNNAEEQMQV